MSQVEITTLGKSCEFFNGKAHEKDIDENGKYIVVNSKFISSDGNKFKRTNKQMFPLYKDDIVMVMSDVPNGKALAKCFIVDKDDTYSLNQRICCLRSKEFDTKYLYYQLNRHEHFLAFNNGENQTNLRKDDILDCPLIKPSMAEQIRLVKELDEAYSKLLIAKSNVTTNIYHSKELFESYLQFIFQNKESSWENKTLGEACELINRGISPKYTESSGMVVLNQKCIRDHQINFEPSRFHDSVLKKVNNERLIRKGDVLVNSTGTGTLGRVAQVKQDYDNVTVDSHITIVRPINNTFYIDFFGWALIFIEDEIAKRGDGCGGQTELARNTLKNDFKISYPKSIAEQEQITKKLESLSQEVERLKSAYEIKLETVDELRNVILKRAFENELIEAE
jgi:type I restriction enzyme, S subunit